LERSGGRRPVEALQARAPPALGISSRRAGGILERIADRLEYRETAGRSGLQKEIDGLGERIRALSFSPIIKETTPEELRIETLAELGFLYLSEKNTIAPKRFFRRWGLPLASWVSRKSI